MKIKGAAGTFSYKRPAYATVMPVIWDRIVDLRRPLLYGFAILQRLSVTMRLP